MRELTTKAVKAVCRYPESQEEIIRERDQALEEGKRLVGIVMTPKDLAAYNKGVYQIGGRVLLGTDGKLVNLSRTIQITSSRAVQEGVWLLLFNSDSKNEIA